MAYIWSEGFQPVHLFLFFKGTLDDDGSENVTSKHKLVPHLSYFMIVQTCSTLSSAEAPVSKHQ